MKNILKAVAIITTLLMTSACATQTGVSEPITEGNDYYMTERAVAVL